MKPFAKTLARALLAASALGALGAVTQARAAEFILFIYESPTELAKRVDQSPTGQQYWAAYAKYGEALKTANVLRGGAALQTNAEARTVFARNEKPQVLSGPVATAKEQLGGFFIIDVADRDAAIAWAKKAPSYMTCRVEVRPSYPAPTM
jgi:hypothetical protein